MNSNSNTTNSQGEHASNPPSQVLGSRTGGLLGRNMKGQNPAEIPLVTVITVVYNGARTLEDTILSIAAQSYPNIEYIVIDGGSSDGTLEILQKYNEQIDYWVSEADAGIYDAMNKGIALARGKYVGMLNSDDYFSTPYALEKIVGSLENGGADAVFSCLEIVDPNNLGRVLRKYRVSTFNRFMCRIGVLPPHPTFYCKKSVYEKAGPYQVDYRIAADAEMMIRMLLKYGIVWEFLDETTVKMRSGGVSSRGLMANWVGNREIIRACTENGLYTNFFILLLKLPIRLLERLL